MRKAWGVLAGLMLSACLPASPLPDMQPGEQGRVVRIIDGDALALNTGQSVRLVGIEAPALRLRGRDPDVYAKEASRTLEDLALGREVRLFYPGMTRDRYDRALAHVVTIDKSGPELWLNAELIRRGAARVRFYPDTAIREDAFLQAEAVARAEKIGLWGKAAYQIRRAKTVAEEMRGFTIVTATLGATRQASGQYADNQACHRALADAELSVAVRPEARAFCELPIGTRMRLRGWVSDQELDLTLLQHAELLEPPDLQN